MKNIIVTIFLFVCLCISAFCDTEVYSAITQDTTWEKGASPYLVRTTIRIIANVSLKIEPGVVVLFDRDSGFLVEGELIAKGTESEKITFTKNTDYWRELYFSELSNKASFDDDGNYQSGSILEHVIVEYAENDKAVINSQDGSPFINYCTFKNNNSAIIHIESDYGNNDFVKIKNCIISDNNTKKSIIKVYRTKNLEIMNTKITNNKCSSVIMLYKISDAYLCGSLIENNISSSYARAIIIADSGNTNIIDNTIKKNSGSILSSIYIEDYSNTKILNNLVTENQSTDNTIQIHSPKVLIEKNTISRNSSPGIALRMSLSETKINMNNIYGNGKYNLINKTKSPVNAQNNWWGTTDILQIATMIFDYSDDQYYEMVYFDYFSTEPIADCPNVNHKITDNQLLATGSGYSIEKARENAILKMERMANGQKTKITKEKCSFEDTKPSICLYFLWFELEEQ